MCWGAKKIDLSSKLDWQRDFVFIKFLWLIFLLPFHLNKNLDCSPMFSYSLSQIKSIPFMDVFISTLIFHGSSIVPFRWISITVLQCWRAENETRFWALITHFLHVLVNTWVTMPAKKSIENYSFLHYKLYQRGLQQSHLALQAKSALYKQQYTTGVKYMALKAWSLWKPLCCSCIF